MAPLLIAALVLLLTLVNISATSTRAPSRWLARAPQWLASVSTAVLFSSTQPFQLPPVADATDIAVKVDFEPPNGSGGIDAFEAASKAFNDPKRTMKALSGNDYQLVQEGKKELSDAPRAQKRRALSFCKDAQIRQASAEKLTEKDCINRVMDMDFTFILEAEKSIKK